MDARDEEDRMTAPRSRTSRAELGARGSSLPNRRGTQIAAAFAELMRPLESEGDGRPVDAQRPRTRGECLAAARPCPWIGCRHSLVLDVSEAGALKIYAHLDLVAMADTCSLDVADRGSHTLEQVGMLMNLTRQRTRQIEASALAKLREAAAGVL